MPVFLVLIAFPLIEIALFVLVGDWLGVWATLLLVILAAMAGMVLIRAQGASAMAEFRAGIAVRRGAMLPMADRALLVMAGMLLILPGFLTDALALLLLVPPVRQIVIARIAARVRVVTPGPRGHDPADVVEGEWIDLDAVRRQGTDSNPDSPWRQIDNGRS